MSRRSLDLTEVARFIQEHIGPEFHDKKLAKLKVLTLESILRRKNPYLFKAKRTQTANDFIKAVLDATVSSGEETVFGNFLERLRFTFANKSSTAESPASRASTWNSRMAETSIWSVSSPAQTGVTTSRSRP